MPFKSEAQRRYLWANEPEVAQEFADKTPKGKLPMHVKPHTHEYNEDDEVDGNEHEYLGHGMSDAAMKAMFAKNRQAGPGKQGIAKPGKLADPGQKLGGERVHMGQLMMKKKPHDIGAAKKIGKAPTKTGPTPPSPAKVAAPKKTAATVSSGGMGKPPAHTPAAHPPKAGAHPPAAKPKAGGGHGKPGGHKGGDHKEGHSPFGALSKIGKAAKEAGAETVKGAVAGTGMEPVAGDMHKSMKGHKYGDAEGGRHDDR